MTNSAILLLKYWLEVGADGQTRRLEPHPRSAEGPWYKPTPS
jgi:polyphosphate kinase 2 (PPK2 family)